MCERLKVASNTEERDQLLVAMMGHSDRMVLENWVASAIQGQLPSQEWGTMFAGLAGNRHHKRLAWNMLTRHWDAVYKVWGQSQFKMKAIIASAMVKADPDEVELFFDSHPCHLEPVCFQVKRIKACHHHRVAMLINSIFYSPSFRLPTYKNAS